MVQPFLPNEADALFDRQSAPESVDFEILLLGYERTGVVSGCAISEDPVTPDLTVDVAAGVVLLKGSQIAVSEQLGNIITTGHATLGRVDLVSINSSGTVVITDGTPAAIDVAEAPAVPANSIPLAFVTVPTLDTTIEDEQIGDKRVFIQSANDIAIRYVDANNGAATNDGLTRESALDDIQDGYDNLPDGVVLNGRYSKGTVIIAPGDYDVGTGLVLDRLRSATFKSISGTTPAWWADDAPLATGSNQVRIFSSEGTISSLVNWGAAGSANGYGFQFLGLVFEHLTAQTPVAVIDGIDINYLIVQDCGFYGNDHNAYAIQLITDNTAGHDSSWSRVIRNRVKGMNLFRSDRNGQNSNQHVIEDNIVNQGDLAGPLIELVYSHRSIVRNNNIEATAGATVTFGIVLDGSFSCQSIGNSGEGIEIFTELRSTTHAVHSNYIADLGRSSPDASDRLVRILAGANNLNNRILVHTATGIDSLYTTAVEDQTASGDNWVDVASNFDSRTNIRLRGWQVQLGDPEGNDLAQLGTLQVRMDGPPFLYVHRGADGTDTDWQVIEPDAIEVAGALTLDWTHGVVNMETTAAARVVTLPDNAAFDGKEYLIHRDGANIVTVNRAGSDTFDTAATSIVLGADGDVLHIISIGDGVWKIL